MKKLIIFLTLIFAFSCENQVETSKIDDVKLSLDETAPDCETEDCDENPDGGSGSSGSGGTSDPGPGPIIVNREIYTLSEDVFGFEFETFENAVTKIEYGTTQSYGQSTVYTTNYKKNHTVIVNSGLQPNTTYHYRIYAKKSNGAEYTSAGIIKTHYEETEQLLKISDAQELTISYHPNINTSDWLDPLKEAIKHWNNIRGVDVYIHPPIQSSTPMSGSVYITNDVTTQLLYGGQKAGKYFEENNSRLAVTYQLYLEDNDNPNSIKRPKYIVIYPDPSDDPDDEDKRLTFIHEFFHVLGFSHDAENNYASYKATHTSTDYEKLYVGTNSLFLGLAENWADHITPNDKDELANYFAGNTPWISGQTSITNTSNSYTYQAVSLGTEDEYGYKWEWSVPGSNNWTELTNSTNSKITFSYPRNGDIELRATSYKKGQPGVDQLSKKITLRKFIDREDDKPVGF